MARPTKKDKRDHQLNLSLTEGEYIAAYYKAAAAGMRLVDYARWRLLGGKEQAVVPAKAVSTEDTMLLSELRRLGNNLNQLVRVFHATRLQPPATLEPLLERIRALINRNAAL